MTLQEFIVFQGGWDRVKSNLCIRTSDTYYICSKLDYNDWEIKKLLNNQMFLEPSYYNNGTIMVFVQD